MTRTARRRWSRELQSEIDGIVLGETGPVLLHGYDQPAGGKWIDSVIPGKVGAFDRNSGDPLWVSPCEVGYGRGFGAGFGRDEDLVVLGPSNNGHRIVRMSVATGELLGLQAIEPFDQAVVAGDLCVTVTPGQVSGIMTSEMLEIWAYSSEGQRNHLVTRDGERILVVYSHRSRNGQGILCLNAEDGEFQEGLLSPKYPVIHEVAVEGRAVVMLVSEGVAARTEQLVLVAIPTGTGPDPEPLWRKEIAEQQLGGFPDVSITSDSGKLYVAHGAMLDVLDALTGRLLGQFTVPGLDERIAWTVGNGAGLLAEETRASIFEIPD